jgi:hypothetical protein
MENNPKTQHEPQARKSREVLLVLRKRTGDWAESGNVIYLTILTSTAIRTSTEYLS